MTFGMPTEDEPAVLVLGDCLDVMASFPEASVDAVVTDPPYGLEFMGRAWDSPWAMGMSTHGFADNEKWQRRPAPSGRRVSWKLTCRKCGHRNRGDKVNCSCEEPDFDREAALAAEQRHRIKDCERYAAFLTATLGAALRVCKPGGYLLAFGGTRTHHRLMCAIEDAGWEIRDTLMYIFASGFPKGQGCLKPAYEPIVLARKPGPKVLPLGIDECRVPTAPGDAVAMERCNTRGSGRFVAQEEGSNILRRYPSPPLDTTAGRWPANLAHDGSDEVLEAFAAYGERGGGFGVVGSDQGGVTASQGVNKYHRQNRRDLGQTVGFGDSGTAARFFFCAKASSEERNAGLEDYQPVRLRADLTDEQRAHVLAELRKAGVPL